MGCGRRVTSGFEWRREDVRMQRQYLARDLRHDLVRSRLRTVYREKRGATASHFFGPISMLSKSSMQEAAVRPRGPAPVYTIDQYFREMEHNRPSLAVQHTGKRAASTAVPGSRHRNPHEFDPDPDPALDSGSEVTKPRRALNPVRLTKTRDGKRGMEVRVQAHMETGCNYSSNANKTLETRLSRECEQPPSLVHTRETSCHDIRPDSRYNKESICAPLDVLHNDNSRVGVAIVRSWNTHGRAKPQQTAYNCDNSQDVRGSKNSPLKTYWQS